jgi:hypothetical protein
VRQFFTKGDQHYRWQSFRREKRVWEWYNDLVKPRSVFVVLFLTIILILALLSTWAIYKGQDVKRLDFKNLIAEFWPKPPQQVAPSKELPQQMKNSGTPPATSQHTEGNQSPAVNVGPGGTANFNYGVPKDERTKGQ